MTKQVQAALKHVNSIFPQVTQVFFGADGRWFFCDAEFKGPAFEGHVDVGLLEEAADSVTALPAAYALDSTYAQARSEEHSVDVNGIQVVWRLMDSPSDFVLDEDSITHIETLLADGYREGELCVSSADGGSTYRGWWAAQL